MLFSTLCLLAGPLLASALPSPYQISITIDNEATPADGQRQVSPLSDLLPFTFILAAHPGRNFEDYEDISIPLGAQPMAPLGRITLGPPSRFKLVTNQYGHGQIVSAEYTEDLIGLGLSPVLVFPPIVSVIPQQFQPFTATSVEVGGRIFLQLTQGPPVDDGGKSIPSISEAFRPHSVMRTISLTQIQFFRPACRFVG